MNTLLIVLIIFIILLSILNEKEFFINSDSVNIYAINLKQSKKRKSVLDNEFKKINKTYNRYPAINGKYIDETILKEIRKTSKLTKGEIGLMLSTCHLWKDMLEADDNDYLLIVEDDIKFTDNFNKKFKKCCEELPDDWDILLIGFRFHNKKQNVSISENLEKTNSTFFGTHGYLINKKFVKKVINYCELKNINNATDTLYSMFVNNKNINIYNSKTELITAYSHNTHGDTSFTQLIK